MPQTASHALSLISRFSDLVVSHESNRVALRLIESDLAALTAALARSQALEGTLRAAQTVMLWLSIWWPAVAPDLML